MKSARIQPSAPQNRSGHATLDIGMVFGESTVTSAFATSPMKLLTPRARGQSVLAYTSSFGGGLVAGDQTRLDVKLGAGARCFIGTQSSTKVYRNPNQLPCGHITRAVLASDSLLVFAPEPVQAFAGSVYSQQQEFHLAAGAGLVLLDWFCSGRSARGERWEFSQFQSRNDVFIEGERAFVDSVLMDPADGSLTSPHRTGRFNCIAMLLLVGPPVQEAARGLLEEMASMPVERDASLVCSAGPAAGGALLRIAAEQVEAVTQELYSRLKFLALPLGEDPWLRKW